MAPRPKCLLHIPHKDWSGDPHERENYSAIERWGRNLLEECLPASFTCPRYYSQYIIDDPTPIPPNTFRSYTFDGDTSLIPGMTALNTIGTRPSDQFLNVHVTVHWDLESIGGFMVHSVRVFSLFGLSGTVTDTMETGHPNPTSGNSMLYAPKQQLSQVESSTYTIELIPFFPASGPTKSLSCTIYIQESVICMGAA